MLLLLLRRRRRHRLLRLLLLLLLRKVTDEATLVEGALTVWLCAADGGAESVEPLRREGQDVCRRRVHSLRRDRGRGRGDAQPPFDDGAVRGRGRRRCGPVSAGRR